MMNCPYCGKLTDPKLDGCPHCGGFLKKKIASAPSVATKGSRTCPSCQAVVQQGDIICVVCGTNLLTGQKVADAPDPESASRGIPLAGILSVAAITVGVFLGGIWLYMSSIDPVEQALELIAEYRHAEAEELLLNYTREKPGHEEAMLELAMLQWNLNRFGDAAGSFQNVVAINPANVDAGLLAVRCLQLSGNANTLSQEIAVLEKVAENVVDNAKVWLVLAMAKGARGEGRDYEEQYIALERVQELSPGMRSARSAHLSIGIAQALLGDYQKAKSELGMASSPEKRGDVLAFQGYVAAAEQKDSQASSLFEQALEADGLNIRWQARTELGKLQIQQGRFQEAETALRQALLENSGNDAGRYLRGIALHSMGRANESLNEFEILVRERGEYSALASVQAASIQLLLGDSAAAERSINTARRAKLESPSYYTVLGRVHLAGNRTLDAKDALDTAIRMDPAYAPAYLERGLLFVRQDRMEPGLRDLNNYLKLLGRDVRGTKANEIRVLTNQLQRTIEGERI